VAFVLPIFLVSPVAALSVAGGVPSSSAKIALTSLDTRKACLQLLRDAQGVCEPRTWAQHGRVSFARTDVDGDGRRDLIVRQVSLFNSGTEGCSTTIYLWKRRGGLGRPEAVIAQEPDRPLRRKRAEKASLHDEQGHRALLHLSTNAKRTAGDLTAADLKG
jgi:hypothetical protein